METYQILGIVGSLLLLVAIFVIPFFFMYGFGMMGFMGYPMYNSVGYHHYFFFFPFLFFILPAVILGLIGSLINNRDASGILLIVASFVSLPVMFGFFGISFILLLVAGILALTSNK
ncbi:hypothetical protein DFR86_03975 [Acidianus sulfidivorans JP7]|uniref:DUF4064 domain-containing protein n=2 Tax=Acidianus TaxID=12914 RepID=A0A2U9IQG6_9CREN|nr:hypothetical protein DFR86_03975 [Acidianus sulfidivorans JP7]